MKVFLQRALLVLGSVAVGSLAQTATAQAPGQVPGSYYQGAAIQDAGFQGVDVQPAAFASSCGCGSSGCDGSCGGDCGGSCDVGYASGCGTGNCGCAGCASDGPFGSELGNGQLLSRPGQFFVGAEWLSVRTNLSESTAYLERDSANGIDTFVPLDFDYSSSYRVYGGYRFCDCGGEILGSYTRLRSNGAATSPQSTATRQFIGPFEVNAITPGSQVSTRFDVDARLYDVDFSRLLPLGSALGSCDCNWCPAWDIQYIFGARYGDIEWQRDVTTTDPNAQNLTSRTTMSFDGAGPRVGLFGRRYIGRNGTFSLFAKGTVSVLLGDVDYVTQGVTSTPGFTVTQRASFTRVIPVTEVEVGGTVHLGDLLSLTGGYMFSAFHDLGAGDQYYSTLTPIFYDDANILGFDGFFARAELTY